MVENVALFSLDADRDHPMLRNQDYDFPVIDLE